MALSELQKIIVGGLRLCGVKPGEIVQAQAMLKTEEQRWAVADYLEDVVSNPPNAQEVMQTVRTIAQAGK